MLRRQQGAQGFHLIETRLAGAALPQRRERHPALHREGFVEKRGVHDDAPVFRVDEPGGHRVHEGGEPLCVITCNRRVAREDGRSARHDPRGGWQDVVADRVPGD